MKIGIMLIVFGCLLLYGGYHQYADDPANPFWVKIVVQAVFGVVPILVGLFHCCGVKKERSLLITGPMLFFFGCYLSYVYGSGVAEMPTDYPYFWKGVVGVVLFGIGPILLGLVLCCRGVLLWRREDRVSGNASVGTRGGNQETHKESHEEESHTESNGR
ncbi:MAG: hypothetical protein ISR77_38180 [Pirellulaceae bacterium]|nr:hypothetical protein [Pirellulaceae bacterium]